MRIRHMPWAIALVCVVLGFMLSTQFKVQQQVAQATGNERAQELAEQLAKAETERDAVMAELEDLRAKVLSMASNQDQYKELAQQLELAQLQAGLIPVNGPGVIVTMNDSALPLKPGENPNNGIIHDEDVLRVINELTIYGAEAISINEQRLVGRTEIRCVGPTVTINGVRTTVPLVIKVVGDPAALETAINQKEGVAESLRSWGIQITVSKEKQVTVPAYKGSLKLQYGTPIKQEVGG